MFALALALLAAPAPTEDLAARLRHLDSAAAAWAPAPSPDATRVAFMTTLFGTLQAASMAMDGGYPTQLTDEPGGLLSVRYVPYDPKRLVVVALREGKRRILVVDDEGGPAAVLDPAPGEQMVGGFARDGKKLFYALIDGEKISLRISALDTGKWLEVAPPPPAAGVQPPAAFPLALADVLQGLIALGPPAPDGRTVLAVVRRGDAEALAVIDVASGRGDILTAPDKPGRVRQPRFTPDGKTIYLLADGGRKTLGVDSIALPSKARKTVYAPAQPIEAFAVSDDGHRLAVAHEANGENVFSLLELPSLRPQPLAAPPAGALAEGDSLLTWDRPGERIFFGWRLADDTTDAWELRLGYGTALRLTRSPRPGLPRNAIPRPTLIKAGDLPGWLWRPPEAERPRAAVLISTTRPRPVFDKRIAALNFAGLAVLAVEGPPAAAQQAALAFLKDAAEVDGRDPLVLDFERLGIDPDHPDLNALMKIARRGGSGL